MPNNDDIYDTLKLFAQSKGSAVVVDNFPNCEIAIVGVGLVDIRALEIFSMRFAAGPLPDTPSTSLAAMPSAKFAAKILS